MASIQRDFRKDKPKPLRVRRVTGGSLIPVLSCQSKNGDGDGWLLFM